MVSGTSAATQPKSRPADNAAMRNVVFDMDTNTSFVRGRDGQAYSFEQVAEAEATPDDPASRALLANIELADPVTIEQMLDHCPECREAVLRGEVPEIGGAEEIHAAMREIRRARVRRFAARPRWRTMKRRY